MVETNFPCWIQPFDPTISYFNQLSTGQYSGRSLGSKKGFQRYKNNLYRLYRKKRYKDYFHVYLYSGWVFVLTVNRKIWQITIVACLLCPEILNDRNYHDGPRGVGKG